jgi:hypothetical protein
LIESKKDTKRRLLRMLQCENNLTGMRQETQPVGGVAEALALM